MKRIFLFLLPVFLLSFTRTIKEIVIPLNLDWKFITGDNIDYSRPDYDDTAWKTIKVDKIWEEQGYDPYDGYAWFRVKIIIPSDLRKYAYLRDSLKFFMGKINNFDQTFLNGQIIGINGKTVAADTPLDTSFINAPTNYWDLERRYVLSVDDPRIHWDQENVIAVRVYDQGGQGGLYTGDQFISMVNIREYLSLDNQAHPYEFKEKTLDKSFILKNISTTLELEGSFSMKAINKLTKQEIFSLSEDIELEPLTSKEFNIAVPQIDQAAVVTYQFDFCEVNEKYMVSEETPYILTPAAPAAPKINGAKIFGARLGHPFLYVIAASGGRPMTFDAAGLPEGLVLDKNTGIISGIAKKKGEYKVILSAKNDKGEVSGELRIVIGDQVALTPPMGWNSWNCWGLAVDEDKVLSSARAYIDKGLINHGWSFINIDDGWEIPKDKEPKRDPQGNILTNEKFPDMKRLGDSLHAMGLKFGIYSSPGPLTCGGYTASYQHELNDARSFAKWGIDYLKYDWCSYDGIAKDTTLPERKKPYFVMRDALDKVDRDIVYSLCQYGMSKVWEWGAEVGGNLWRTTGDITDTWESMSGIGFTQVENAPYANPSHWNDPDMLVVGLVGWGPQLHPTKLTPDEQYTHISLWSLLASPLLIGGDMSRLDPFTLSLLSNDEVIEVNQDPLGKQASCLSDNGGIQIWAKEMDDGSRAVGLFYTGSGEKNPPDYFQWEMKPKKARVVLSSKDIGINGKFMVRDVWRQTNIGTFENQFEAEVPYHGVVLIKVTEVK